MTRHPAWRTLALFLTVPVLTGTACYQYSTRPISAVRRDETVHVVLSPEASASLASSIGPNATTIDGKILGVNGTTLRLAVTQVARSIGPEEFMMNEPLDIPAKGASSITVRSLDRARTILAVGGILAGAFAARMITDQPGIATVKGGPSTGTK